jgi:putative membrane protein
MAFSKSSSPNHPETNDLILRDTLAIDRTRLANQRTFLAFVRTGIYFIATALGIFHLDEKGGLDWLAWAFVVIGIASMITGIINYFVIRRKIIRIYKFTN